MLNERDTLIGLLFDLGDAPPCGKKKAANDTGEEGEKDHAGRNMGVFLSLSVDFHGVFTLL
jgi:hypothetical protein